MLRFLARLIVTGAVTAALGFWWITRPDTVADDFAQGLIGDATAGATIFAAGGCASCHAAPNAEDDAHLVLAGGTSFPSDFGTFYAPNISPDRDAGIGGWSLPDFANAVTRGVSPDGAHYYPAFPYGTYARMTDQDVVDLYTFMATLPVSSTASQSHDVGFPFSIRRAVGVWKQLYLSDGFQVTGKLNEQETRGRYLAEALGHCAECHTARDALGGLDRTRWLGGAPNPTGKGTIPNITPGALDWSEADLVAYFTTGLTPEYDSAGGEMVDVIRNLAQLPETDRAAIAAYLKRVPAVK